TVSGGGSPVVGVERDGGEDPPTLVDLHQREILDLATAVGRPARRYDALDRDAVPHGADESSFLVDPRTGPALPVGDPPIEVGRDPHVSTPVLVLRVRHEQGAESRPI